MPKKFGAYTYYDNVARYRSPNGRFVSQGEIRKALDTALANSQAEMRRLGLAVKNGNISLATFQTQFAAEMKQVHLVSTMAGKGGFAQMTQADFGRVGARQRQQLGYLNQFMADVESGKQPLNGQFLRRIDHYVERGRETFLNTQRREMGLRGYDMVRSIRNATESCSQCIDMDGKWYKMEEYTPIGQRQCMGWCACDEEYKKSEEADIPA